MHYVICSNKISSKSGGWGEGKLEDCGILKCLFIEGLEFYGVNMRFVVNATIFGFVSNK